MEFDASPLLRRCTESARILNLCAHATMNWGQFSSEIIDDSPYCNYGPRFHTVTYARNSGLSPKDIVVRHPAGSVCQSRDGDRHATERAVPVGVVTFLNDRENSLKLYSEWYIQVQYLREYLEERQKDCTNRQWEVVGHLSRRLDSLEVYLCPHVTFSHPIFEYAQLINSDFAPSGPKYTWCPSCGASFSLYVEAAERNLVEVISRNIGTGESAVGLAWVKGTTAHARR
jgi:hypothetical protein